MVPLILYVSPELTGAVTLMVPVVTEQVGCVILTVGAEGGAGELRTATVAADIHVPFFTLTL